MSQVTGTEPVLAGQQTPAPAATPSAVTAPERPPYIPDKYWTGNPEESTKKLAEAHVALEARFTKTQKTAAAGGAAATLAIGTGDQRTALSDEAGIEDLITGAGLDPGQLMETWRGSKVDEQGQPKVPGLTDEHYAALRRSNNLPRRVIDQFFSQQDALQSDFDAKLVDATDAAVGGAGKKVALMDWAKANLTEQELAPYNDLLDQSDAQMSPRHAVAAIKLLEAMHVEAVGAGKAKPLLGGTGVPVTAGAFRSRSEYLDASRDPRYGRDKEYTASVDRRAMASDLNNLPMH